MRNTDIDLKKFQDNLNQARHELIEATLVRNKLLEEKYQAGRKVKALESFLKQKVEESHKAEQQKLAVNSECISARSLHSMYKDADSTRVKRLEILKAKYNFIDTELRETKNKCNNIKLNIDILQTQKSDKIITQKKIKMEFDDLKKKYQQTQSNLNSKKESLEESITILKEKINYGNQQHEIDKKYLLELEEKIPLLQEAYNKSVQYKVIDENNLASGRNNINTVLQNYDNSTAHYKNINRENYGYNHTVETKHHTRVLGFRGDPWYSYHTERRYNDDQYNRDRAAAEQQMNHWRGQITIHRTNYIQYAQALNEREEEIKKFQEPLNKGNQEKENTIQRIKLREKQILDIQKTLDAKSLEQTTILLEIQDNGTKLQSIEEKKIQLKAGSDQILKIDLKLRFYKEHLKNIEETVEVKTKDKELQEKELSNKQAHLEKVKAKVEETEKLSRDLRKECDKLFQLAEKLQSIVDETTKELEQASIAAHEVEEQLNEYEKLVLELEKKVTQFETDIENYNAQTQVGIDEGREEHESLEILDEWVTIEDLGDTSYRNILDAQEDTNHFNHRSLIATVELTNFTNYDLN
jgi:chromosome segregation ATPase